MVTKSKIDLFDFLGKLNKTDRVYIDSLSDQDKKSFAPVVIMRWLSGTSDSTQIVQLNQIANPLVFRLYQYPNLLFKLLMASCTGNSKHFKWIKNNGKIFKHPASNEIIMKYYKCSKRELRDYLPLITKELVIEMAEALGEETSMVEKEWS